MTEYIVFNKIQGLYLAYGGYTPNPSMARKFTIISGFANSPHHEVEVIND